MADPSALREKRLELQELEATKAYVDPALYEALHSGLVEDLAELEGTPAPPRATKAPLRATKAPLSATKPPIRLSSPRKPQPADAQEVAEPPQPEVLPALPVKKKHMGPTPLDPQAKLAKMLAGLLALRAAGKKTDSKRHEIRAHCKAHGLVVPDEAHRLPMGNPRWLKDKPQMLPHQVAVEPPEDSVPVPGFEDLDQEAVRACREEMDLPAETLMLASAPGLVHSDPKPAPMLRSKVDESRIGGPASSLRALRSQALDLLPAFEDLDQEAARACREEMDLLAETLVLGGHLINRRSA